MKFSSKQNEISYDQVWEEEFWIPLVSCEHFAISNQDIKTLYDFGNKIYKMSGYNATTKFFTEQLEILTKGEKKCQKNTKLESASGFLSLLARLLSCCASLKKLWKLFR